MSKKSTSRFRARLRKARQAEREVIANENFDPKFVSRTAGIEWVRHGGSIETYKRAWPSRELSPSAKDFFNNIRTA